jgi:hypothetical protein
LATTRTPNLKQTNQIGSKVKPLHKASLPTTASGCGFLLSIERTDIFFCSFVFSFVKRRSVPSFDDGLVGGMLNGIDEQKLARIRKGIRSEVRRYLKVMVRQ